MIQRGKGVIEMKKQIVVGIILAAMLCALVPLSVLADTVQYITITATGSDVDITCNQTSWNVGTVHANDNIQTSCTGGWFNWGNVQNDGSEAVNVAISGENMTDAAVGFWWALSDTATVGASTFGMRAGLTFSSDNIIIKKSVAFNDLFHALLTGTSDNFGLEFLAPSSGVGNLTMEMVGATDLPSDVPRGLVLTGTIHT